MKQTIEFDDIDRRILGQLQSNALLSNAELAERVGSSAASCWRRVRNLETAGVLGGAVRLLNPSAIGCDVTVLCNVRVRSYARETRSAFEDFVRERPEIIECYSMSGEWDYLLRIVVRDVADYESFLMRTLLEHPSVDGASSHFALSQTKYTTALPL